MVEPVIAIGSVHSITGVLGAVMVSGIIVAILSGVIGKLIPYFPPIVAGSVILIIGVSLMPVAMKNAAGGVGSPTFGDPMNLMLACFTLVSFLLLNTLTKGFLKAVSVLFAMVLGTILAGFFRYGRYLWLFRGQLVYNGDSFLFWGTYLRPFIYYHYDNHIFNHCC
ncbi:solute carrier family 23 protein [Peribacillus frigoritolerans]|nr:solute carrier family 23 protein [Peribacillus frigoritolerans]